MNTEMVNTKSNFKKSMTSWILTKIVTVLTDGVLIQILFNILCKYTEWTYVNIIDALIIALILNIITKNKLTIKIK